MKKIKKQSLILTMICVWMLCMTVPVMAEGKLIKRGDYYFYIQEDGTALKNSWKTLSNGKTCYFGANGARYTGVRTVGNKTYGFSGTAGYLKKNDWAKKGDLVYRTDSNGEILRNKLVQVNGNYYYFGSDGVRFANQWKTFPEGSSYFSSGGKRVTGEKKINGKLYYFNSKGYLVKGKSKVQSGGNVYYLDGNGAVELKIQKSGSAKKYYNSLGKQKNEAWANNYLTLQKAKKIAGQITTENMTQEQKLFACFQWVVKKPYVTRRTFTNAEGWPAVFANDHFLYGSGNCHSDAAAFAYLAKAVGYQNVYVCSDSRGRNAHSWTEINGRAYDPLFWEAKGRQAKYYGGAYGVFELSPILHIAIG